MTSRMIFSSQHLTIQMMLVLALLSSWSQAQIYPSAAAQGGTGSVAGISMANLGDMNGDGVDDIITGSPVAATLQILAGRLQIFSGTDLAALYLVEGNLAGLRIGQSVAGLGDIDGDGIPDYLTGGIETDATGTTQSGHVSVYSGATATILYSCNGDTNQSKFGMFVEAIGDVDGDGITDFAVGAPQDSVVGVNAGMVRIFSGMTGATLFTRSGADSGDRYGSSLAAMGDLDGDGIPDLVIGAYLDENNFGVTSSGSVQAISGATSATLWTFNNSQDNEFFGIDVAPAGDINLDGIEDVAVSSLYAAPGATVPYGRIRILSGSTGAVLRTLYGDSTIGAFAATVSNAGDMDGDGIDDLLATMVIGTPYTVATAPARGIRIFSGFNGSIIDSVFRDDGTANQFGAASCSIGDVNGDGRSEFACSNPYFGDMGFTTFPPPPPAPGLIQIYQARGPVVRRVQSEGRHHLIDLSWLPAGGVYNAVVGSLVASGAVPGSSGIIGATLAGTEVDLFGYLPLLLDLAPQFALVSADFGFDFAGGATFPNVSRQNAALAGMRFHVQVFSTGPIAGSSNALIFKIAP